MTSIEERFKKKVGRDPSYQEHQIFRMFEEDRARQERADRIMSGPLPLQFLPPPYKL
jgi:hypothetical protein